MGIVFTTLVFGVVTEKHYADIFAKYYVSLF